MGDRFEIDIKCAYCSVENKDIYFAPTCSFCTFNCLYCGNKNFINSDMNAVKIENLTEEMVYNIVDMTANFMSAEQIKRMAHSEFLRIKNGIC